MITKDIATARREEVEALATRNGGTITPQQIVDFARDPNTAMHTLFVWDDTEVAKRYREVQAATFLRVRVRLTPAQQDEPVLVRAYVNLSTDRGSSVFRPIETVLSDETMRATLLSDAKRELIAVKQKYGHLQELSHVWDALSVPVQIAA